MLKKVRKIIAFGALTLILTAVSSNLQTQKSYACNEYTCVDSGYAQYEGRFFDPVCIYSFWVSGIYACEGGNPWFFLRNVTLWPEASDFSTEMTFHSIDNLCAWFSTIVFLVDDYEYEYWFVCPKYGSTEHYPLYPDCW